MSLYKEKVFFVLAFFTLLASFILVAPAHAYTPEACYGTPYDASGNPTFYPTGSDNCFGGEPVTTVTLSAFSPSTITQGQTSSISFSATHADWCDGNGVFSGRLANDTNGSGNLSQSGTTPTTLSPGTYSQTVTCGSANTSNIATSVTRTLTVTAPASPPTYTISASAGTGCTISPSGNTTVTGGGSQSYSIGAQSGYTISSVNVDGANMGAPSSYTFSNVNQNHTISATCTGGTSGPTPPVCALTHYNCTTGIPSGGSLSGSYYNWSCTGFNGGGTISCSEYAGGGSVNGQCAATHYNCTTGSASNKTQSGSDYSWTCLGTNGGSNASCSEAGTAYYVDLSATLPTYTTSVAGTQTTFSSQILNYGNYNLVGGFYNYIRVGVGSGCASDVVDKSGFKALLGPCTVTDLPASLMPGIAGPGVGTKTNTYIFPTADTYYVQACADHSSSNSSADTQVYTETNEANCSEVRAITVTSGPPPPPTNGSGSCSADGTTGTFSWTAPAGYNTFYTRASSGGVNLGAPAWDDNFVGTSKTFPTTPGTTYDWWVHTKNTVNGTWSTSIGGSFTCPTPPSAPASLSGSCLSPGTTGTYSWPAVSGATYYALRNNNTADGWDGTCTSAGGDFCSNETGTSRSFSSTPSATYGGWIHACNTAGCSAATVSSNFTCSAPPSSLCPATTINNCVLPQSSPGQTAGSCSTGYSRTCSYTCDGGGSGSWQYNSNLCAGPDITQFEICLWNGSSATGCGSTIFVATGTPLAIRWNSQYADTCARQSGPTDFSTGGAVSGIDTTVTASTNVNTTSTYTLICTKSGSGASADTAIVSDTTNNAAPRLTTSRATVRVGDSITLSWDTNNSNEGLCTLSGGGLTSSTLTNGTGDAETGSAPVTITGRTTFTLTCSGLSDLKTVEIIPQNWES